MNGQLIQELEALGGDLLPASLRECDEIVIDQPEYHARIALWGGHLVSFVPTGQKDLLFQSANQGDQTRFGRRHFGVPVCWPWFGANEKQLDYPAHGLARYFRWQFSEAGRFKNGDVKIVLRLASEDHPLLEEMWPQAFELRQVFRFTGDGFSINFSAANLSDKSMAVTEALHTYFHVGDNRQVQVQGLDGVSFIDKLDNGARKKQSGVITPFECLDSVYIDSPDECVIEDVSFARKITLRTEGSQSTVLWNPGPELAKKRADMEDEDYRHFVCVETANALNNGYEIASGEMHQLRLSVTVEALS
ncbi:Putative glucose-6-phosphate 1-epimerase [Marinomonas spartinae]|uniref:Putative glucose-6-phosphate 1-epimerase n=1 Tax=Marinomonas spartinae TaxID=1792290 RepID=A0A1A8T4U0_9GAMM|nr:D-hexose-6-phosphate mutarotase [Marinomonas spartinae]SBS26552.1 Putative glucose-6-phosphate 1-epimerase [Marinomonas spartinae]SBS40200.1 Putative glucose-6-phosphate 1-epimerase [Marinomonas spartinae]